MASSSVEELVNLFEAARDRPPAESPDAGKSYNAALSAVQILGVKDAELRERLTADHGQLQEDVAEVAPALGEQCTPAYREGAK